VTAYQRGFGEAFLDAFDVSGMGRQYLETQQDMQMYGTAWGAFGG